MTCWLCKIHVSSFTGSYKVPCTQLVLGSLKCGCCVIGLVFDWSQLVLEPLLAAAIFT